MQDIYAFLAQHGISYVKYEHPAVFTCEAAESLALEIPGVPTKNLLLRNRSGNRHILVVVGHEKVVDLKAFGTVLGESKLSFASPERLRNRLGVEPGSVTILGLICDSAHLVDVVCDEAIWNADALQCHPLANTATLVIAHDGIETFLGATGHDARILAVPGRTKE